MAHGTVQKQYAEVKSGDIRCLTNTSLRRFNTVFRRPGTSCSKGAYSAIQWINLYSTDIAIGFPNIYPLDSDLSNG